MPTQPASGSESEPAVAGADLNRAVIQARDLVRRYGEGPTAVEALRGVSLDVARGQLVAVMGPSGSGKSTLMHILAGLDNPDQRHGDHRRDRAVGARRHRELTRLRRDHIGFVFQFFNLLPMLTAEENIVLPLSIANEHPDRAWVDELLDRTGLAAAAQAPSGAAVRRRAAAGGDRAGADHPPDGPARRRAHRQPRTPRPGREILELLRDSVDAYGQTTVMVTHDPRAASIADRILFIADGQIVKELTRRPPAEVLRGHERASADDPPSR